MKAQGESFCFSPVFNLRDLVTWHGSAERHGQDTEVSFMSVNYRRAGQRCLLPLMPASFAGINKAMLAMPVLFVVFSL